MAKIYQQAPSLNGIDATDDALNPLLVQAEFDSSVDSIATIETVVGKFAPGCLLLDINTGATYYNRGTTAAPVFVSVETFNSVTSAPGLRIHGGSASPLAQAHNGFTLQAKDTLGVPVAADTDMPALAGGNLAFDNGTVPPTTLSCRMYTFLADVNTATGAVTLSTINGADFPKNRPVRPSTDINYGDGTKAIVGFLYVKNESSAVFIPGTTNIDASGITHSFGDAFGYPVLG